MYWPHSTIYSVWILSLIPNKGTLCPCSSNNSNCPWWILNIYLSCRDFIDFQFGGRECTDLTYVGAEPVWKSLLVTVIGKIVYMQVSLSLWFTVSFARFGCWVQCFSSESQRYYRTAWPVIIFYCFALQRLIFVIRYKRTWGWSNIFLLTCMVLLTSAR